MHCIGSIPFRLENDEVALLFVTSQTRRRWIFPKGSTEDGETAVETCLREAMEEAGVAGRVLEDFPITTPITRQVGDEHEVLPVTYYPLLVTEQGRDWPEKNLRRRRWASLGDAEAVAARDDFKGLLDQFRKLLPFISDQARAHLTFCA